jgi:hypothetical protein
MSLRHFIVELLDNGMWRSTFCFCVEQYLFVPTMPVCYPYVNSAVQLGTPGWCFSSKPPKVAPGPWELEGGGGLLSLNLHPSPPPTPALYSAPTGTNGNYLFIFLDKLTAHQKWCFRDISACYDIWSIVIDLFRNISKVFMSAHT